MTDVESRQPHFGVTHAPELTVAAESKLSEPGSVQPMIGGWHMPKGSKLFAQNSVAIVYDS